MVPGVLRGDRKEDNSNILRSVKGSEGSRCGRAGLQEQNQIREGQSVPSVCPHLSELLLRQTTNEYLNEGIVSSVWSFVSESVPSYGAKLQPFSCGVDSPDSISRLIGGLTEKIDCKLA